MQIVFEVETAHGKFCDALYFEDDAVPDEATIEAMKQERVDNWIAFVTAPPAPPEPDYVEIDGVQYEKIDIDGQTVLKPVGA
jgi:hypothetical protein